MSVHQDCSVLLHIDFFFLFGHEYRSAAQKEACKELVAGIEPRTLRSRGHIFGNKREMSSYFAARKVASFLLPPLSAMEIKPEKRRSRSLDRMKGQSNMTMKKEKKNEKENALTRCVAPHLMHICLLMAPCSIDVQAMVRVRRPSKEAICSRYR